MGNFFKNLCAFHSLIPQQQWEVLLEDDVLVLGDQDPGGKDSRGGNVKIAHSHLLAFWKCVHSFHLNICAASLSPSASRLCSLRNSVCRAVRSGYGDRSGADRACGRVV